MPTETRRRCSSLTNNDWTLSVADDGTHVSASPDHIQIILLWEVLQELKRLNGLLNCGNFRSIPKTLRAMQRGLDRRTAEGRKAR